MRKHLLTILIILILCLPFFASADLGLEHKYPELPGEQTLVVTSTLPQIIKYFSTWAVILASLVVLISLIVGGFQYLTSTGHPAAMTSAKSRVTNSFLGLLILLCSYLILVTVNPQLTILRLEKAPVPGVLLLTKEGYDKLTPGSGASVEELLSLKQARYLNQGIEDCEKEFGQLKLVSPAQPAVGTTPAKPAVVNFENFPLYGIALWKETKDNFKVVSFGGKKFKSDSDVNPWELEYSGSEKIKKINFAENYIDTDDPPDDVADVSVFEYFKSPVPYKDESGAPVNPTLVSHPPLSIDLTGTGLGIYLVGDKSEQRYLPVSVENLKTVKFNDKAKEIRIENDDEHDYIAVLHDDSHYSGQLRVFFESKERKKFNTATGKYDLVEFGNTNKGIRTAVRYENGDAVIDKYGKVKKPSSVWIGEISEEPKACEEVRICTEIFGGGECIVYMEDPAKIEYKQDIWLVGKQMPLYGLINIPEKIEKGDPDENKRLKRLKQGGASKETEDAPNDVKFADNIESLKITGDCLVVLFEHAINNPAACSACEPSKCNPESADGTEPKKMCDTCKQCWDHETPGGKSEIFGVDLGEGRGIPRDYWDLNDNEITSCGTARRLVSTAKGKSCASAIAIYPIKGEKK